MSLFRRFFLNDHIILGVILINTLVSYLIETGYTYPALYAVDIADVQLILEVGPYGLAVLLVALLRQEVAVLLLDVVRQMQLNGVLQRVGIRLCQVWAEVPHLIVHDVQ